MSNENIPPTNIETKDPIKEFLQNLNVLTESKRHMLKRCFGKPLERCGIEERMTLELLLPEKSEEQYGYSAYQKEIFFFVACAECLYSREHGDSMLPKEIIAELYCDKKSSDSYKKRIISMISKDIIVKGTFLKQLNDIIRTAKKKGMYFNMYILTKELLFWNKKTLGSQESISQKSWINAIIKKQNEIRKDNNNEAE